MAAIAIYSYIRTLSGGERRRLYLLKQLIDSPNVLEVSQFWRNVVHELHKEFADVELSDMYVDNAAMPIVPGIFRI